MAEETKTRKWIKGAVAEGKGKLHDHLGVPEGEKIPEEKLREALNSKNPSVRKEANLAMVLKGFHHEKKKLARTQTSVRGALYGAKD